MRERKLHFWKKGSSFKTACGLTTGGRIRFTCTAEAVTCRNCLHLMVKREKPEPKQLYICSYANECKNKEDDQCVHREQHELNSCCYHHCNVADNIKCVPVEENKSQGTIKIELEAKTERYEDWSIIKELSDLIEKHDLYIDIARDCGGDKRWNTDVWDASFISAPPFKSRSLLKLLKKLLKRVREGDGKA